MDSQSGSLLFLLIWICTLQVAAYVVDPGRHVCMQQRSVSKPVKRTQSYCKPYYQNYVKLCDQDKTKFCTSFRVQYKTAMRTVYQMQFTSQMVHACCPGWTQRHRAEQGCMIPICSKGCYNGGVCGKPEMCICNRGWTGAECQTDIDECKSSLNRCEQKCVNTMGSYRCECESGFELGADNKTCQFCLKCIPEYNQMLSDYENLKGKVVNLERDKENLKNSLYKMELKYTQKLEMIQNDMEAKIPDHEMNWYTTTTTPSTTLPTTTTEKTTPIKTTFSSTIPPTTTTKIPKWSLDKESWEKFVLFSEDAWNRIASLGEQIAIFEERLALCSCS